MSVVGPYPQGIPTRFGGTFGPGSCAEVRTVKIPGTHCRAARERHHERASRLVIGGVDQACVSGGDEAIGGSRMMRRPESSSMVMQT